MLDAPYIQLAQGNCIKPLKGEMCTSETVVCRKIFDHIYGHSWVRGIQLIYNVKQYLSIIKERHRCGMDAMTEVC